MTTLLPRPVQGTAAPLADDEVDVDRDRQLVARAQAGDRCAFDELYRYYYRRLLRFCVSRLHDTHEAEDVVQEAFARAWRALPTFAGERRFYPWLSVIAGHLCVDSARRRSRTTPVAELHPKHAVDPTASGEEQMVAAVEAGLAAAAFGRLNDRHQRVLQLREHSGWSYQAIAEHEGVGLAAVETLLWRARQSLKREFAALTDSDGRLAGVVGGLVGVAAVVRRLLRAVRSTVHAACGGGWATTAAVGSLAAAVAVSVVAAGAMSSPRNPAANHVLDVQGTSAQHLSALAASAPGRSGHHTVASRPSGAGLRAHPTNWLVGGGPGAGHGAGGQGSATSSAGTAGIVRGDQPASTASQATVAAGVGEALGGIRSALSGLGGALGLTDGSTSTVDGVGTTVSALGTTVDGVGTAVSGATSSVGSAITDLGTTLSGSSSGISSVTTPLGSTVSELPSQLTQTLGGALGTLGSTLSGTGTGGSTSTTGSGSTSGTGTGGSTSTTGSGTTTTTTSSSTSTSTSSSTSSGSGTSGGVEGVVCDVGSTVGGVLGTLTNLVSGSGSGTGTSCPS